MRFYYFEPEKVYTLKEFIQTQSTIIEAIDSQLKEVSIFRFQFYEHIENKNIYMILQK